MCAFIGCYTHRAGGSGVLHIIKIQILEWAALGSLHSSPQKDWNKGSLIADNVSWSPILNDENLMSAGSVIAGPPQLTSTPQ